ncbi:MAG TPA: hypothetical protein VGB55_08935, partial [Tepidisphaeraceae bacterium]
MRLHAVYVDKPPNWMSRIVQANDVRERPFTALGVSGSIRGDLSPHIFGGRRLSFPGGVHVSSKPIVADEADPPLRCVAEARRQTAADSVRQLWTVTLVASSLRYGLWRD